MYIYIYIFIYNVRMKKGLMTIQGLGILDPVHDHGTELDSYFK